MADNVNIIVQDTINDIVVNAAVVVETIDINVQAAVDTVDIVANPNNYVVNINRIIGEQVQSDWNQSDNQAPDYIKNKPTIPAAQVNSDWDATSGVAEILNKPTIPAAVTKTSDLINDGENGVDPFITAADIPPVTGFVPYTGATDDVNLGTHDLTATQGTFATSGNPDTLTVNHSSGSGKALTITKGGAGEGIYVNKTSGSGNAVTIVGDLEATNLKRTGGTSSQFLKANGSVDSNTYFQLPTLTSGSVLFSNGTTIAQNNANLFWDDTNNRLGIGTSSPTEKLQVSGNSIITGNLSIGSSSPYGKLNLATTSFGTQTMAFVVADGTQNPRALISYVTAFGAQRVNFSSSYSSGSTLSNWTFETGKVGIGTTGPSIKLQVETSVNGSDGIWARNTNTGTLAFGSVDCVSNVGSINLRAHSSTHSVWANTSMINSASAFSGGMVLFQGGANPIAFWTNSSERLRIHGTTGNVLINTTTDAGYKLDVNGTARVSGNATFGTLGTGTGMFWDNTNNRLGIGTTAPYSRFTINGALSTSTSQISIVNSEGGHVIIRSGIAGINNTGISLITASVDGSSQVTRMVINGNGNVLINTTTDVASSKLTIASTTQGFLPPRMTTTQKNAIATPAAGLMIYDNTLNRPCFYDGTTWITL